MSQLKDRKVILNLFCNLFTKKGKKSIAEKFLLNTFYFLRTRYKIRSPADFTLRVFKNLRPVLGVRSKQVAATRVKLPMVLTPKQKYFKAMTWIVEGAKKRNYLGHLTSWNLAREIFLSRTKRNFTYANKQYKLHKKSLHDTRAFLRYLNDE
jgi:ribosomal protein S7